MVVGKRFTGRQRLAAFVAVVWIAFAWLLSSFDYSFNWTFFIGAGVLPVGFIWGLVWVIAGFRQKG